MTSMARSGTIRNAILLTFFALHLSGQVNILTNRYNLSRTASNLNETQLNVSNVNTNSFGLLGKYFVDGVIFAQPLYVVGVTVNGAPHNVLYVATMHDVLYAFDADNVGSLPLWTLDFRNLAAGISPPMIHPGQGDGTDTSVSDTFGIFGTPVIDLPNNLIFFVTHTNENGTEYFRLRSVDIRTGQLINSTVIAGSVPASAQGVGATFIPNKYGERAALEIVNGKVWVAFGSRPSGDYTNPYQGWIMAYDETTFAQTGVFATSQTNGNGVWQSGAGPAVDSNSNVYYLTGNGGYYDGVTDFPMTLLQMNGSGSNVALNNWFTPDNSNGLDDYVTLDNWDLDLSVNGPMLIPGTDLLTFGSKTADVYVLHTGNLGQLTPGDTQLAQLFHVGAPVDYTQTASDRIIGMAYWQNPTGGTLYVWPGLDTLHAYNLNPGSSTFTQSYAGTFALSGQPSTALALSANGTDPTTGILWAPVANSTQDLDTVGEPGILHAYNASNPAQELWNSNQNSADYMGTVAKFVPPVVVNGKAYVANSALVGAYGNGSVTVYGLKSSGSTHVAPSVTLNSPANSSYFTVGSTVTIAASPTASAGNTVTSVEFMDGTTVLATIPTAPYTFNWTAAGIGSHTLTAVAIDQAGSATVSFALTVMVVATPLSLAASPAVLQMRPGGSAITQINITNLTGITGSFLFSVGSLPSGVTAAWSTTTLTLTASATAALATTNVTVTATSNGVTGGSLVIPVIISQSGPFINGVNLATFSVPGGVTLGTPIVFTEGAPSSSLTNPDFALVSAGTTCTSTASGACNVQIQFTPQFAGLRRGAVELVDSNNNVLSTQYFYGNGTMPQPAWSAAAQKTIYKNGSSHGVAVDGAGNVYVLDSWKSQVFKIAPGGTPQQLQLGLTLNTPFGLALDAAGNLYIGDSGNNRIVELPYGASSASVVVSGLNDPIGLAVDGAGNLYIANNQGSYYGTHGDVIEVAAGTGLQTIVAAAGLGFPTGVAVDAVGDIFIADSFNNRVFELAVGGAQRTIGHNLSVVTAVAVDGLGDVFITDQTHNQLVEVPATAAGPGTGIQVTIATGLVSPYGLALDGQGDLFIVNAGTNSTPGGVLEIPNLALLPTQSITFGSLPATAAGTFVTLSGSASSGLTINYTSKTLNVCTVSGNTAIALAAGVCTITASQPGNSIYPPAASVTQSFGVTGPAQTVVVPFNVPSGTTLATPVVFTEGVPSSSLASPDFTIASNACTASATGVCTVNIQFTPRYAGLRRGAIQFLSSGNTVLATTYFFGNGNVSQPAWSAGASKALYKQGTRGVAVDGAGNVFLLDSYQNAVFKITPGGTPALVPLGLTLNSAYGLALDAAGNLYIADAGNNRIVQLPYGSSNATVLNISGLTYPEGVAVDGAGNLFIADTRQTVNASGTGDVIKFIVNSGAQTTVLNAGLNLPSGVAVDAVGDLFIADKTNNRVLEIPASGAASISLGSGLSGASSVAVDGLGDVFIADLNNNRVVEEPATANGPGTGTQVTVATGLASPYGLALDGVGDVFIVNAGNANASGSLVELPNNIQVLTQSITFGSIATQPAYTSLVLTATASSGLQVSYSSSTPSVCTVSGGAAALITPGTCTITAAQAGNGIYAAATSITQSFLVAVPAQLISVPFTVPAGTTLGTPVVFTEGVPSSSIANPDFTLGSNTCTGVSSGSCAVSIQFAPKYPGLRRGAVQFMSSSNTGVATSFFSGNGAVTQSPWLAGPAKSVYSKAVRGVAVDGAGDVFVLDLGSSQVYKIVPGGTPALLTLGLTLNSPYGLALDAAGNLYIGDAGNNRVVKLPYAGNAATVLNISGLTYPEGLAVDGAGNLFIANTRQTVSSGTGNVIEFAIGAGTQTTVLGSGLNYPSGVAVDAAGDLFIADKNNNRVVELPAGGAKPLYLGTGLSGASTVAVDGLGDVFITDQNHNTLVQIPGTSSGPGTGTQLTIATGLATPYGVAVDGAGDIFVANVGTASVAGSLLELQNVGSQPQQSITFGAITSQAAGTFLTLTATASSGLAVSYASSTLGVCTVSGSTATLLAAGSCRIAASQPGNSVYPAAASVVQSFTVTGTAQTIVVPFNIPTGTTLGTPVIFTEGVPSSSIASPDFTLASSTCSPSASGVCKVSIQFTPRYAGLRRGALQFVSASNTLLSTVYFSASGTLSLPAWTAGTPKTLYGKATRGIALDGAGDAFLLDLASSQVYKIAPGGTPTLVTLGLALNSPYGLALDAAGNLYIADAGNNRVVELLYGSSTASVLNISGLNYPEGVAVDGAGNLFIANTRQTVSSGTGNVIEFGVASGIQTTVAASGLSFPSGVAVDAAGDVFIADKNNNRVLEIPASGAAPIPIGTGISAASTVAVDGLGDVFITDQNHNSVVEVPGTASGPATGTQATVATGLATPYGLAVDGAGNLFIVNVGTVSVAGSLVELPNAGQSAKQSISFSSIASQPAGTFLTMTATASSGLAVSYTSTTVGICTVSGVTAALLTPGICTITASQVGNGIYPAAASVTQSFSVTGTAQTFVVPFNVPAGTTLGTPVVFTEGVPSSSLVSPDFVLSSNTCTGAASGVCTVTIQFTPRFAGLRRAAVQFVSSTNTTLSTTYLFGNGTVSQAVWTAGSLKTVYTMGTRGVALDAAGNVFVLDSYLNQVYKIAPGGTPTLLPLGLTLNSAYGLALDAAGNLYIADAGNNRVVELPYGSATATVLNINGLTYPEGLAVDGSGNLFIANTRQIVATGTGNVIEFAISSGLQTIAVGSGVNLPSGVAVDGTGDLFVADKGNNRVLEIPASGGAPISMGSGLSSASTVEVDGVGDVFITDMNHNQLVELPATASGPGTGTQVTVASGLATPYGLALDGFGDVFIVNAGSAAITGSLLELPNSGATAMAIRH